MRNQTSETIEVSSSRAQKVLALAIVSILIPAIALWCLENLTVPAFLQRITWLNIHEVKIESEWPLQASSVRSWLPALEGKSILSVRGADLVAALSAKPWVSAVTIKKEYPNRLLIDVVTKRAHAIEVDRRNSFFLDGEGRRIEKTTPDLLTALDLPVLTRERLEGRRSLELQRGGWNLREMVIVLDRFQQQMSAGSIVSQIQLGSFPYFKVFLSHPRLEVTFSVESWESQLPILALLLHNPPRQIGQPQRINLILPKKAVVSSHLSN